MASGGGGGGQGGRDVEAGVPAGRVARAQSPAMALLGGHLCDPVQGWDGPADVYLADGRVCAVLPPGAPAPSSRGAVEALNCAGLLVVPGPIDTLCHLSLREEAWREDMQALARAAVAGGYTAVLAHTGCGDPVAALTAEGALAELGLLADAGAVAYESAFVPNALVMRRALEYAGSLRRPILVQPQDPSLARGGVMHEGVRSFAMGLRGIPAVAEVVAVQRDAALQRAFGGRLHFAAVSSAESLPHLGAATASVTAHHLLLTEDAVEGYRTAAKLTPPLRTEVDRERLVAAARDGRLLLASGHRPCPPEEKACEYDYAAFGATAVETASAVALQVLGPRAFVMAASAGPAAAFGLPGGTLAPNAPADLAVFAPTQEWEVDPAALLSRGRSTPLAGMRLRGAAVLTVVGGHVVFRRGTSA